MRRRREWESGKAEEGAEDSEYKKVVVYLFFFFKQKTAYEVGTGDWSSDVCSSDLHGKAGHNR